MFPVMAGILDKVRNKNKNIEFTKTKYSLIKFQSNNILAKLKNKIANETYGFLHKT
jgi:hypothetical protein